MNTSQLTIFDKDGRIEHVEEPCTFRRYVANGRLKVGDVITIADVVDGKAKWSETFVVGDCTPINQPTRDDKEDFVGWNLTHERMSKMVLEVVHLL